MNYPLPERKGECNVDYVEISPKGKDDARQDTQKKALMDNQLAYAGSHVEQELR